MTKIEIDPTTPLGFVSAQDVLDACTLDLYAVSDDRTAVSVEGNWEDEAQALFDIKLPDGYEASDDDCRVLGAMLQAAAEASKPTVEEYEASTFDPSEDIENYNRSEAAELR